MAQDLPPAGPPARAPGPWDLAAAASPAPAAAPAYRQPAKQSLAMAILSTALLAGIIGVYGGWQLALAGVIGVFVHEYGHVLAMNALGCGPARIHIVPFLGGAASPARPPATEFRGVLISLAGPVFGLLAVIPFLVAADLTDTPSWLRAAAFVCVINLINLFPAPPLDGSRVLGPALARIHPTLERVVLVLLGIVALGWAISRGSFLLAVPLGFGIMSALGARNMRQEGTPLTNLQWPLALLLYLIAIAACLVMLYVSLGAEPLGGDLIHRLFPQATPAHGQGGYRI
jgi:Zn-dependent protease